MWLNASVVDNDAILEDVDTVVVVADVVVASVVVVVSGRVVVDASSFNARGVVVKTKAVITSLFLLCLA